MSKTINSAVTGPDGEIYLPGGDAEKLNEVLPVQDVERLINLGIIGGDGWTGYEENEKTGKREPGKPEDTRAGISPLPGEPGGSNAGFSRPEELPTGGLASNRNTVVTGTTIPDGFPGKNSLATNNDITTMEQLRALSDEEIDNLKKLKPETKEAIKTARVE